MGLLFLLVCCATAKEIQNISSTNHKLEQLLKQATSSNLSSHSYWLALLHYRPKVIGPGIRSEIVTPNFFLAKDGAYNAQSELLATLAAFLQPIKADSNQHAQCRFPARYRWLRQQLNWQGLIVPVVRCDRYLKWSFAGNVQSISLIFVTGYLGNPASFYGHVLLKFNLEKNMSSRGLLDTSINYGAVVEENENGLVYVIKGLFGGYEAAYSDQLFYHHNYNYGEIELRDSWEYALSLTPEQIHQVIAHSWELLDQRFVYYFTANNCAYQMAKLLELVVQQPLARDNFPWILPFNLFDQISRTKINSRPLVSSVHYSPSQQSRFLQNFIALKATSRSWTSSWIKQPTTFDNPIYQAFEESDRQYITESLIDYYSLQMTLQREDKETQEELKMINQKVLIQRLRLPPSVVEASAAVTPDPPHLGQRPSLLGVQRVNNSELGSGFSLQFRPAYYDQLALTSGRPDYSQVMMFDLSVLYLKDQWRINKLDLVNIEALNVAKTDLPTLNKPAWRIRGGWDRTHLACSDCVVPSMEGGIGKAMELLPSAAVYLMAEGRLQSEDEQLGIAAVGIRLGIISHSTMGWQSRFSVGERYFLTGAAVQTLWRFENRFGISPYWDLRIAAEKNQAQELIASAAYYW
jgi:hypothetical protein